MNRSWSFLAGAGVGGISVVLAGAGLVLAMSVWTGAESPPEEHDVSGPSTGLTTVPAPARSDDGPMRWDADRGVCAPTRASDLDLDWRVDVLPTRTVPAGTEVTLRLMNPLADRGDSIDARGTVLIVDELGAESRVQTNLTGSLPAEVTYDASVEGEVTVIWHLDEIGWVACHGFSVTDS